MANYLKEAFQSLDLIEDKYLKEETFQLGKEKDIEELEDMIDYNENGPDIEEVIDLDADSIEEVKDSYVGDIVIQCPNCTHMYYKTEDEINLEPKSEESDTLICNVGEECYYCGSESGYDVIGRVAPYEEKVEVKEKEVEKVGNEVVEDEEEFDEVSFDEHFNTYLSENYKNRVIYSTKRVYKDRRGLIVEGIMEFSPTRTSKIRLNLRRSGDIYYLFNENLKKKLRVHTSDIRGKIITENITSGKFNSIKKLSESANPKKRILFASTAGIEYTGIVNNLSDARYQSVVDVLNNYNSYFMEDISGLRGMYLITVDTGSEEFWLYNGSKYDNPLEWDEAIYNALVEDATTHPEESVLSIELDDIMLEVDREDLDKYKHYITDRVKYSDDSFLVKFTPSSTKSAGRYHRPRIYSYDGFADDFSLTKDEYVEESFTPGKSKKDLMNTKGTIAYVFKDNLDKIVASGSLDKMKEEAIKLLDSEEITQSKEKVEEVKSRLKAARNMPQFISLITTYATGVKV